MTEKELNKALRQYLREIKKLLICDWRTKNKFIADFKIDLYEYIADNKVSHIDEVQNHFGEPYAIAKGFLENADIRTIKKRMNFTKVLICAVISALLVWTSFVIFAMIDTYRSNRDGYIVVEWSDEMPEDAIIADVDE